MVMLSQLLGLFLEGDVTDYLSCCLQKADVFYFAKRFNSFIGSCHVLC